jgi:hypothetical protein
MTYFIRCSCNQAHEVSARQAGSGINCGCGRRVPVPPLSELRQLAGQTAYEVRTADRTGALVYSGELPRLGLCAACGLSTSDVRVLYVEREQAFIKGKTSSWGEALKDWGTVLGSIFLFFSSWLFLFWRSEEETPRTETGRDTVVQAPLYLDA